MQNGVVVDGSITDHSIGIPDAQEDINDPLENFHGKETMEKFSHDIKVATVVFQLEKEVMPPYKQLVTRQQTKNEDYLFNKSVHILI